MPELPEVETIRRQLAPLVEGRKLRAIEVLDWRWSRPLAPSELEQALIGRRIERLGRRGKYLVWSFSGDVHLAQHLRMTGAVLADPDPAQQHVGVRMELSGGGSRKVGHLAVVDPRRFGTGELLLGSPALEEFFAARLGLEPFDELFTAEHLRQLAKGRTAPIKAFLLDQRKIAGVGNIYADEALHRAGVHPRRPAGRLSREQYERLRESIIAALSAGIDAQGREHRRLPSRRWRAGLLPEPVPRAPARGRAVLAVRLEHRQDGRRRARHLRVRDLPAARASDQAASALRPLAARPAGRSQRPPAPR